MAEQAEKGQGNAPSAANFVVADGAGGGTVGGGAGFSLSRDAMTTELGNLRDLQGRIERQLSKAVPMWSIESPGQDPASLRNTAANNKSGEAYGAFLTRQSNFANVIIGKMEAALGMHTANDDQAAQTIKTQGDEGQF